MPFLFKITLLVLPFTTFISLLAVKFLVVVLSAIVALLLTSKSVVDTFVVAVKFLKFY